ncbi:MAG TPA: GIDE domain-containing protein [Kofleriaceae bacterium]|nr:GIDE domain-containing protein [Kofleriaceae bacterium]
MEALALVLVLGGIAAGATWYWSATARLRRALRRAKRVSIADAPEGAVVRLDGRVLEGETLEAPLTGRRCVYYVAIVEEFEAGSTPDSWRELTREARGVQFTIEDGTGRAIVDPEGARVDVDLDRTASSGALEEPTAAQAAFLERRGVKLTGWSSNRTLRYREGVFEVGEPIAVMCRPMREPDPGAASREVGYREAPSTRLRVGGSARHPILLSDARELSQ